MSWKTATKYYQKIITEPKITISAKTHKIYFNSYIKKHFLDKKKRVIIRYDSKSKMMSFQPVYDGEDSYSLVYTSKDRTGVLLYADCVLRQFNIIINEKLTFKPHWDSNIEWLTIDLNNGGNDE